MSKEKHAPQKKSPPAPTFNPTEDLYGDVNKPVDTDLNLDKGKPEQLAQLQSLIGSARTARTPWPAGAALTIVLVMPLPARSVTRGR